MLLYYGLSENRIEYFSDEGDSSTSSSTEYREDFGSITLVVPPPSPIHFKKAKPKLKKKNPRNRSPNVSRKPLPMCKATLELSVTRRLNAADRVSETSDDSDSESDVVDKEKSKPARRRKKKKKVKKKQKVREIMADRLLVILKNGQLANI